MKRGKKFRKLVAEYQKKGNREGNSTLSECENIALKRIPTEKKYINCNKRCFLQVVENRMNGNMGLETARGKNNLDMREVRIKRKMYIVTQDRQRLMSCSSCKHSTVVCNFQRKIKGESEGTMITSRPCGVSHFIID